MPTFRCSCLAVAVPILGLRGLAADRESTGSHVIALDERVLVPEEGLLLGNGDLSVSVYQTADRIVWRFGKGDVWDRRLDLSDDPKPAHIDEIARGIRDEGWKCGPYGGPVEATRGSKDPKRMRELCQGAPPSYNRRPYPCPKPVGELALHLPPDLPGLKVRQRLSIEEAVLRIECAWPSGVKIEVESLVAPAPNVLVVRWKTSGWNERTRMGQKPPVWFSLYRWADPTIQAFAARFFAECRHAAFLDGASPKATPLPPPTAKQEGGAWLIEQAFPSDPLLENLWYETLHARRSAYRRGAVPPGLFLPSTVQDYSHWHGDYHMNYNFQEPFWGDYTANQLELGDAYFDGVAFMLPIGRKIARDYYGCRGACIQLSMYPILAEDDPLGVVPMGRIAYMTGWTVNQYWWRYLYTLDRDWLRATGYPVIRDCALFYTDFLKKGPDGRYHAFPSNQGEDGFSGNPKDYTDRAQVMQHVRYCLRAAIRASEVVGRLRGGAFVAERDLPAFRGIG
jgi:hypothetical protein